MIIEPKIKDYCLEIRRHLHKYPELSFSEENTCKYIQEELQKLGIEGQCVADTGVYAVLDSGNPGPVVAIRADIDALPIQEENDLPFASVVPGVMHACGHDGHAAIAMGLARVIKENINHLNGKIILVFQPAEESPPGGALKIIESGILDKAEFMLGVHMNPQLPYGKVGIQAGAFLASVDKFEVRITGRGGHAAIPHVSIDPIVIATQLVNAWQTIISRRVDPLESAVLTVGTFNAGTSFNTIPNSVEITGTVRTLSEKTRLEIEKEFVQITQKLCEGLGGAVSIDYDKSYPVLINDQELTQMIKSKCEEVLGQESIIETKPILSGDDFAYYGKLCPLGFFFLGAGFTDNNKSVYPFHHPCFDFNEESLFLGIQAIIGVLEGIGSLTMEKNFKIL